MDAPLPSPSGQSTSIGGVAAMAEGAALQGPADQPLAERERGRLRWRCRRGLLENDLFIERFFTRHESGLTLGQARGLYALMDLSDNDLLDLLLRRREPEGELASGEAWQVLEMLRTH